MKKLFCQAIICCLVMFSMAAASAAQTIMYIPFDDRPVSLSNEVDTVHAAGFNILTPPAAYLASRGRSGDPFQLWGWVEQNAAQADALVLSADALLYGGLVDSRIHSIDSEVLLWRVEHFARLKAAYPKKPIYVYSTIMCSPLATGGGVQPPYYEFYGNEIFRLMALRDKGELEKLSTAEQSEIVQLQRKIPADDLRDWLGRRAKNFAANEKLIELTKQGTLDYLIMGRDDTAPYSRSHQESRELQKDAATLDDSRYETFPGADQLGMVLLARAYNKLSGRTPVVAVQYSLGSGSDTVATYEDQPFGRTIAGHIAAAGGKIAGGSEHYDLFLAVNTPLDGHTPEAEDFCNIAMRAPSTDAFVSAVKARLTMGIPVAVADIAFANGADNTLMKAMYDAKILERLSAYSGWNTASNTLGFAIGQGMMAHSMADADRKELLAVRYLDDWAYQANIRKELYRTILYNHEHDNNSDYPIKLLRELDKALIHDLRSFTTDYLWLDPKTVDATFPWNRLFEIYVTIRH